MASWHQWRMQQLRDGGKFWKPHRNQIQSTDSAKMQGELEKVRGEKFSPNVVLTQVLVEEIFMSPFDRF